MFNDIMDLIRRRPPGGGFTPTLEIPGNAFGGLPGGNPVQPAGDPGLGRVPLLTQPPPNFIPGLGGIPRGEDKPSAGLGNAGVALPPPGPDNPLPGPMTVPGLPGATAQPFTPRSIDVSPWGSGAVMRQAGSRDEELMALAERAGARASANAMGTGYLPGGQLLDPRLGMQASQDAVQSFLRTAAAGDENQSRERMGAAQLQNQRGIAEMSGRNQLDLQRLQNQGLVDAARERANHEQAMGLNKSTLDLIGAMATNPGIDPKAIGTAMDFLKSQRGQSPGMAPGAAPAARDSADKGVAGLPQVAPADPLAAAQDMARRNQILAQFQADFAPEGGDPNGPRKIDPASVTKMIDRLQAQAVSPEDRAHLVEQIRAGKFGDPAKFQDTLYQIAAKNYLLGQGINGGINPLDRAQKNVAVPYGDNPDALFTLRSQPASTAFGRMGQFLGGGITAQPFNQVVTADGRVLPLDAPLNIGGANNYYGLNADDTKAAPGRTSNSAQLLNDLIRAQRGR